MRFLVILVLLWPAPLFDSFGLRGLVIWNVGQGQFVTLVTDKACIHFDMGGERFPKGVVQLCRPRENFLLLSHWDWDHIGLVSKAQHLLPHLCLVRGPLGKSRRQSRLDSLPRCEQTQLPNMQTWSPRQLSSERNDSSHVWLISKFVLLPGDSTRLSEAKWTREMKGLSEVPFLLLGHHGSRTSTSQRLLNRLTQLRVAIASSRYARFHHPHHEVVARLKRKGVAVLTTESWGSIFIEAPLSSKLTP